MHTDISIFPHDFGGAHVALKHGIPMSICHIMVTHSPGSAKFPESIEGKILYYVDQLDVIAIHKDRWKKHPGAGGGPCANPVGLTINFCVPDVRTDATHQRLVETGHTTRTCPLPITLGEIEIFQSKTPNGITLYRHAYSEA